MADLKPWRPEGLTPPSPDLEGWSHEEIYWATVDDVVRAIKKAGVYYSHRHGSSFPNGWLVFIPEKEQ